jgi:hypothetical protein
MSDLKHIDEAADVLQKVNTQVEMLASAENKLERGYAYLGYLLLEVYEMQYWRVRFESFRAYLQSVADEYHRSSGRLHQYFLTVRDLSDTFNRNQLETMGITKAIQIRGAKDYAIVLPPNICDAALDPNVTVQELRKLIATVLKFPDEDGEWLDLDFEFMVSPEERATLESAIEAAKHCDPVIKSTISRSAQMKEVALRWAMEFIGGHPSE